MKRLYHIKIIDKYMKFGLSWWGENWLKALEGVDFTNRIPRGKSYANTGKVYDIKINGSTVSAKVKGKSYKYYDTEITFRQFTPKQIKTITKTINDSEFILSSLLNHELPTQLYDKLFEKGIQVFPTSIEYLDPDCNCPDYAYICKHIAGLLYMIAHEVDKDPFQVFKLQGCDLLELLDFKPTSENIKKVNELFNHEGTKINSIEVDDVDFSKTPDLLDNIFLLLNDEPLFFEKDFKKILNNIYKGMGRFYKKSLENYTAFGYNGYEPYTRLGKKHTYIQYTGDDYEDIEEWLENTMINQWSKPNQWEDFSINITSNYEISKIKTGTKTLFDEYNTPEALFTFFTELSLTSIDKFNNKIQCMNLIYQFSLELIKKHALIPELFKNKNHYYIRWIPAIFDKNISEIINKISATCPDDLITYDNQKISKKDQIITGISLFIKGFFHNYLEYGTPATVKRLYNDNVFRLFFFEGQKFDKFTERGYENLINQWLSKFILNSRDYDLYLVIKDDGEAFNANIQVEVEDENLENISDVIEKTKDNQLKSQLLSDVYLINEVFPEVNNSIDIHGIVFDPEEFSKFFIKSLPLFEIIGINIILPKNLRKIFKPKLSLDIASSKNERSYLKFDDLVKFDWKVMLGNTTCSPEEFKELSEKSRGLIKVANQYIILDENETKTLIKQIDKLPEKLNQNELLKAVLSEQLGDAEVNIDGNLRKLIKNMTRNQKSDVPANINGTLREYQKVGFSWLVQNIKTGFGSILADDMGLGKTLQVLTAILHFKEEGMLEKEKVLIVAPTSLLTNWQKEIEKFTPDLTTHIYHGTARRFPKKQYDVYLTSYGVIRRDAEKFKKRKWFITVVDEAQNIKNPNTKQSKAIKSVKSKHRIALSGTPVENRLSEYWSIFDFINKGYLTSLKKFRDNYIIPIEKERNTDVLNNFKQITQPFILRRVKSDKEIISDLPDKITNDVYCSLTKEQTALYKETLDVTVEEMEEKEGIDRKGTVLKLITSLKQICNHPAQYTKSNRYSIEESGKMEVLINTLENILEANEKVLVFTQYVEMGNIMKEIIEDKLNVEVLFLHGSLPRKKRDEMVDKFQNNTQNKIFILSLKAGGTGLNLTAASNVIHYDLWWNPAVENQATDRAYRIGQKDNVMVYRFITNGTFEERINDMIHDKEELAELTVGNSEQFITEMSDKELKEMFKLRKQ